MIFLAPYVSRGSWWQSCPLPFDFSYGKSPFLMMLRKHKCDFSHPIHSSYYLHIPELLNKRIFDSKYGWLLVEGTGDEILSIFFLIYPRVVYSLNSVFILYQLPWISVWWSQ